MKRLIGTAFAIAVLAGGAALAHPGPRGERDGPGRGARAVMMLGAADFDGDNTVTRAELERLQAEEFAFRDRNGDGYLDAADRSPMQQRLAQMRGEEAAERPRGGRRGGAHEGMRLDADEDGRVSQSEFLARQTPMFERLDANGDGSVTATELDAALEARSERREARRTPWWRN